MYYDSDFNKKQTLFMILRAASADFFADCPPCAGISNGDFAFPIDNPHKNTKIRDRSLSKRGLK